MKEVIHHDREVYAAAPQTTGDGSSTGVIAAVIIFALLLLMLFYFGLPALGRLGSGTTTQVNVPDKINLDVNQK